MKHRQLLTILLLLAFPLLLSACGGKKEEETTQEQRESSLPYLSSDGVDAMLSSMEAAAEEAGDTLERGPVSSDGEADEAQTPTPTETPTPTDTPTPTPTNTPTPTPTPKRRKSTPTPTPRPTATPVPTNTPVPTATPSPTPASSSTQTPASSEDLLPGETAASSEQTAVLTVTPIPEFAQMEAAAAAAAEEEAPSPRVREVVQSDGTVELVPEATPTPPPTIEQASAYVNLPASEMLENLGEPISRSYAPSAYGNGEDGTWRYDGFFVFTYRQDEHEMVIAVSETGVRESTVSEDEYII